MRIENLEEPVIKPITVLKPITIYTKFILDSDF